MKLTSFLVFLFLFTKLLSQSVNDYRSINSGNWTTVTNWEIFNGTTWIPATTYPGQTTGTNDVSIEGGVTITLSSTIPNSFNSLTVGDSIGGTDTLEISNTSSLNTLSVTIATGGFATWTSNVTLFLPAGAAFIVESGGLDTARPCSAAKRIQIGTIVYSTCNGGAGADSSFSDINDAGGSLNVSPTSNAPICVGEILNLFANPSGTGSTDPSVTYSWSASGPSGYTFSSSIENPTITGLISGSYVYTVTITLGAIFNTNSVNVIVGDSPNPPISDGNKLACTGATIPTLTATVNANETIDWYDSNTGGVLLLSNNTSFTPTAPGSYFAQARNTITSCSNTIRTEITLTVSSCTVITNRRITYRVR